MNARTTAGRLLVGVTSLALMGGCAAGGSSTPQPASAVPTSMASATAAAPTATAAPSPSLTIDITSNVAYEADNPLLVPGRLHVVAPAEAGPWPVVVMLHGGPPLDRDSLMKHARRVASLGFVVFVPTWGAGVTEPDHDVLLADQAQAACAVAFARAHAAEYGGDPATMIVFGHSAGANMGALVAFGRPAPTAGCLGGTTLGAIDALITWEGDWLAYDPMWDSLLAADPRIMGDYTPWSSIAAHKDLKVVMLVSENPNAYERDVSDPPAAGSWLAVRDPSGAMRHELETVGALADGIVDLADLQQLFFSVLRAQGNPVSLDVMPGSTHMSLSDEGWKIFLAAFPKAAGQD